jgi:hypothetical protein
MDNFKEFLHNQKNDAYTDEPSNKVWLGIQQQLSQKQPAKIVRFNWKIAVAACCILLAGLGLVFIMHNSQKTQIVAKNTETKIEASPKNIDTANTTIEPIKTLNTNEILASNSTEIVKIKPVITPKKKNEVLQQNTNRPNEALIAFENLETSFKQVINIQKQRLNTIPLNAENPFYYAEFINDFKKLEKEEKRIKQDIIGKGISNENLENLISVYQYKLNILKQLQTEINKTNSRYKQNREAVDTVKTYFLNL